MCRPRSGWPGAAPGVPGWVGGSLHAGCARGKLGVQRTALVCAATKSATLAAAGLCAPARLGAAAPLGVPWGGALAAPCGLSAPAVFPWAGPPACGAGLGAGAAAGWFPVVGPLCGRSGPPAWGCARGVVLVRAVRPRCLGPTFHIITVISTISRYYHRLSALGDVSMRVAIIIMVATARHRITFSSPHPSLSWPLGQVLLCVSALGTALVLERSPRAVQRWPPPQQSVPLSRCPCWARSRRACGRR